MMNETIEQMELDLAGRNTCPRVVRRERGLNRARWWFDRMRQVVEQSMDWEPAPRFQPEQIWLPGADRTNPE
jgi:hypothetical protein